MGSLLLTAGADGKRMALPNAKVMLHQVRALLFPPPCLTARLHEVIGHNGLTVNRMTRVWPHGGLLSHVEVRREWRPILRSLHGRSSRRVSV